ncbi:predicted protein [Nematostella vectensis]|uniref:Serine-threonine kinase receptor-associated protein n=1 Tax=Nematostella vectensis TaxID=45351 RepID=A7T8I0_NEMVE|nr:predicted protein [Nematostella vectensis]|eukprot:XP_001619806.1 hypothetical protein NEMVEDRAFT_v1g150238 [Nematostella vectensis]
MARQIPLSCSGHTRPVVDLHFSDITPHGYFLISACKGEKRLEFHLKELSIFSSVHIHSRLLFVLLKNTKWWLQLFEGFFFFRKVWDALSGDEVASLPHKHIVKTVDFSSDGIRLLTGSNEKILRIFDLQNLDSEPQVLTGHTGSIKTALWNKENNMVYSGGDDKMIR